MLYGTLRQLLFRLEAERVHDLVSLTTDAVASLLPPACRRCGVSDRPVELKGIRFPNRLGLAAGFDKEGRFLRGAQALGFGFTEIGAVTPKPQPGHARPRMWRYPEQRALRNKMGFNNPGAWALARRLADRPRNFPCGVNLGKNASTPLERAVDDYLAGLETLYGHADFFVVNVSSPNTEGLRSLQNELSALLDPVVRRAAELAEQFELGPRPILVKLSPDIDLSLLAPLAESALRSGVDGFVAANTTSARTGVYQTIPAEGGLSGPLLHENAVKMVELLRKEGGEETVLIGCGGVRDVGTYQNFLAAGADLVQLYTGLIYEGPGLIRRILKGVERDV
ncbi:MAG: quinone-dependent dihydroorotate dehydrogenase [Vulcanimicrobiota bacterium]